MFLAVGDKVHFTPWLPTLQDGKSHQHQRGQTHQLFEKALETVVVSVVSVCRQLHFV